MYSDQDLADMHFLYVLADVNAVVARRYAKKGIQDGDVQMGKHLEVSISAF
jgi:hypothetical protein